MAPLGPVLEILCNQRKRQDLNLHMRDLEIVLAQPGFLHALQHGEKLETKAGPHARQAPNLET